MHGIKIIASDYDGTLRKNRIISSEDLAAIKQWQACGNRFGLVTGRSESPLSGAEGEPECDFYILGTGVQLLSRDFSEIINYSVSGKTIEKLLCALPFTGVHHMNIKTEKGYFAVNFKGTKEQNLEFVSTEVIIQSEQFFQMNTWFDTPDEAGKFTGYLNTYYSDCVCAWQNGVCVDITPPGVSKASGIQNYADICGIRKENIYTVGDSFNDLSMLCAFNGFAMNSGEKQVIKAAANSCDSIADMIHTLLNQA